MTSSPSRSSRPGRKQSASADALAAIFGDKAKDFETPKSTATSHRQNTSIDFGGHSSSSPSRLHRSSSPGMGLLNNNRKSPMHIMTDARDLEDFAYRPLEERPKEKEKENVKTDGRRGSGDGTARTEDDLRENADEEAVESSDNDSIKSSDDEGTGQKRGRGRSRTSETSQDSVEAEESEEEHHSAYGESKSTKQAKSALAAAEDERMSQSKDKLRQTEPRITINGPGEDKPTKSRVHPTTSYDMAEAEEYSSDSTDPEVSDIRRAQKLAVNQSFIDQDVPNRGIRTVIRGEFQSFQKEAKDGFRRLRTYVAAVDLSPESVYALEWAIGTTLRDGDTMICLYAIEDENAVTATPTKQTAEPASPSHGDLSDGAKAAQDTMSALDAQTAKITASAAQQSRSLLAPSSYLPATDSRATSTDSRNMSKGEIERARAIEDITATCLRLLRKTKLQVRLAIECIHCRNPKHLIIEAIDVIEPVIVIVGSRGRSNVKGVLLGSFSNYLLTRSSVPTMVARAKLKKHAKAKSTGSFRLTNNLQRPNRLTTAKVD